MEDDFNLPPKQLLTKLINVLNLVKIEYYCIKLNVLLLNLGWIYNII